MNMTNASSPSAAHSLPLEEVLCPGDERNQLYTTHPLVTNTQHIRTSAIMEALSIIINVIQHRMPGTCFVGESRAGKSWTQDILKRVIPGSLPRTPIGQVLAKKHDKATERGFYTDVLLDYNHSGAALGDTHQRRVRVVNTIQAECAEKESSLYVLFVDEAQNWGPQEWEHLKDLSNLLQKRGITLITISFAHHTLEAKRAQLLSDNRTDLI